MDDFIADSEEEDGGSGGQDYQAIKEIRQMFKYNPNRYKDEDDDIDNMETDYHSLLKEEKHRFDIVAV
jgi:protein SPT2